MSGPLSRLTMKATNESETKTIAATSARRPLRSRDGGGCVPTSWWATGRDRGRRRGRWVAGVLACTVLGCGGGAGHGVLSWEFIAGIFNLRPFRPSTGQARPCKGHLTRARASSSPHVLDSDDRPPPTPYPIGRETARDLHPPVRGHLTNITSSAQCYGLGQKTIPTTGAPDGHLFGSCDYGWLLWKFRPPVAGTRARGSSALVAAPHD